MTDYSELIAETRELLNDPALNLDDWPTAFDDETGLLRRLADALEQCSVERDIAHEFAGVPKGELPKHGGKVAVVSFTEDGSVKSQRFLDELPPERVARLTEAGLEISMTDTSGSVTVGYVEDETYWETVTTQERWDELFGVGSEMSINIAKEGPVKVRRR